MKNRRNSNFSILGFFLFFLTIAFTSTITLFVYIMANKQSNGNTLIVISSVLLTIVFGALVCTIIDIIRRRKMVERPVQMILDATKKIAAGNFKVKLVPLHDYFKYDEYDIIFENINKMTTELCQNEILKNDFISNVSHEIKTPLSIIQNYAKLLENENLEQNKKIEYIKGLTIQTKKLSELITNILKLNKLENQEIVAEIKEIDFSELVRTTALNFENMLEIKKLELICDIEEVKIISSETLLEIVLNNLISNAVKFTDNGGKIFISLKQKDNFCILKVRDTGCGMTKEIGEHIFDKFYQGDTSHASEGNGLGLALVKKVIDIIGGEIFVESIVGKGTLFTIKLKRN